MNKETSQQIQDYPKINCLPSLKAINWAWLGLADSTSTSCRFSSSAFSGAVPGQYSRPSTARALLFPFYHCGVSLALARPLLTTSQAFIYTAVELKFSFIFFMFVFEYVCWSRG